MAYSVKFREQVMKFIDNNHTIHEAHEVFEVGTTTIKRWKKLKEEKGTLENQPLNRKATKLCPEQLKAYVSEKPDSYQSEIAEVFSCTQSAVSYALKRLQLTRKKNG